MARILYLTFPHGEVSGGHKMILRHVETLRELGFDAACWTNAGSRLPQAFRSEAPVEVGSPFRPDDVLVIPSDAPNAIAAAASLPQRTVIFCQNQFTVALLSFEAVDRFGAERTPPFIAVGPTVAAAVRRAFPGSEVVTIPCFADERLFRRGEAAAPAVACSPRKRREEARLIRNLLRRLHPRHDALPWTELVEAPEEDVARAFAGSSLFLSLSRFEAVGMTPLEAMASGCVCAGFTGVGGADFATAENGFWVPEDDCWAAADALAQAADLVAAGGAPLRRIREAGFETARRWSYAAFRPALAAGWSRLAPEAAPAGLNA